jgi:cyclopropane fatty-acyl-phospholipid synthase-like methyltransferase
VPADNRDDALHVVDLGCGVGATLIRLAQHLPMRGTGVTLSPVQADLAAQRVTAAGLAGRVACIEADFCALPLTVEQADAAFAIESFVHVTDASRFFEQCRKLIRPGGLLIICDDFRNAETDGPGDEAIERFCQGWHVNTLLTPAELHRQAAAAGFEHQTTDDLTPYLRIPRPRDRVIGAFVAVVERLPFARRRFDDLIGGRALQTCLRRGWITYQLAVFRRC